MAGFAKYLVLFILLLNYAIAQKAQQDTSDIYLEEEIDINVDTSEGIRNYLPEDLMFVPAAHLYNHQWDNRYIRINKINPAEKKDTTLIIFNDNPDNNFYFPVKGKLISPYGYRGRHFHAGVDIKLNRNDSVFTVMAGKVRLAKVYRGYGNVVVVRHFNGLETVYGHLNKICVKVDDDLKAGDLIGLGGRTGRATCDHLHFETRFMEQPINPLSFADFENSKLTTDTIVITASTFTELSSSPKKTPQKNKNLSHQKKHNSETKSVKSVHTVKSGDNLYSIAKKNNTTVKRLCELNNIKNKRFVKPGEKIILN